VGVVRDDVSGGTTGVTVADDTSGVTLTGDDVVVGDSVRDDAVLSVSVRGDVTGDDVLVGDGPDLSLSRATAAGCRGTTLSRATASILACSVPSSRNR
jgi:hypothetical protein